MSFILENIDTVLAHGDVWIVGSDPANGLYDGGGYLELQVEKLPTGDFKIHDPPVAHFTVDDLFDFNYWNGSFLSTIPIKAAASIQCAHGRKGTGVGGVALLRFEVRGEVDKIGAIIIERP